MHIGLYTVYKDPIVVGAPKGTRADWGILSSQHALNLTNRIGLYNVSFIRIADMASYLWSSIPQIQEIYDTSQTEGFLHNAF